MTTSHRRLSQLAVCIASASLMASQPALAGPIMPQERFEQAQPETLPSITEMMQMVVKFIKEMQDAKTQSMTSIKRG